MSKKKILHIVEAFGGGVYTFLEELSNRMAEHYDVVIAYSKREQTPENFMEKFNENVKFIQVKNFTRNISLPKDIKALIEIKKIINVEKPDIVHLHSSKAGVLGRLAIKQKKNKMFYNPHGFSFLKQDDSKVKRAIYWLIEKCMAIFNRNCTIVGCSNGEYEEAKKLNKNAICINNGVDIEKLNKETFGFKEKKIDYNNLKICTVGRIGYQKNPEMFNEIAKSFPKLEFTWIGDGELRHKLTSANITITGWKTRNEVLQILNNQDVFILTSLWEGLPISLLEAMYMKKTCIVSNCIGNRDVILNGNNGFIANTLQDYNNFINKILNRETIFSKEKIFEYVEHNFSVDKMAKDYIEKYTF